MIYYPTTFALSQTEEPLQSGVVLTNDGQALVSGFVNGVFGVKVATGAAGEVFSGFLKAQTSATPFFPTVGVKVEETTLPTGGTYQLAKIPLSGTISVYNETDGALIAGANVAVSAGGLLTVTGADNKQVLITYQYTLSAQEATARVGSIQPGGYAGQYAGTASVMKSGTIYTDQFDTTVDWRAATGVKLAAGGIVTNQAGTGTSLKAQIVSIPTVIRPFLGLRIMTP